MVFFHCGSKESGRLIGMLICPLIPAPISTGNLSDEDEKPFAPTWISIVVESSGYTAVPGLNLDKLGILSIL